MPNIFDKTVYAVLDFKFDLAGWLAETEIISGATVEVETGITLVSSAITNSGKSVTYWLSGGTLDEAYTVTLKFETNAGRKESRIMIIKMKVR